MKIAFLLALIAIASSQQFPTTSPTWSYCNRPGNPFVICGFIYDPVCGVKATGLPDDYPNSCEACNAQGVIAYQSGRCRDISKNCSVSAIDCTVIRIIQNPSCAFLVGKPFEEANWFFCCKGTTIA